MMIEHELHEIRRHVLDIESKLNHLTKLTWLIVSHLKLEEKLTMANQETLARLASDVTANTDATNAAAQALAGFVQTVADLTAQLQAAIEGGDETAIQAAADALEANNAVLVAAVQPVAQAVVANTPAGKPAA